MTVFEGDIQSVSLKAIRKFLDDNGYNNAHIKSLRPAKIEYEKTNDCDEVNHVEILNYDYDIQTYVNDVECIFNGLTVARLYFISDDNLKEFIQFTQIEYGFTNVHRVSIMDIKYALNHNNFKWIKRLFEQVNDIVLLHFHDQFYNNEEYVQTWCLDKNKVLEMKTVIMKEVNKRNLFHEGDIEL